MRPSAARNSSASIQQGTDDDRSQPRKHSRNDRSRIAGGRGTLPPLRHQLLADLIAHLLHRYHQTHRAELAWLIPLAQKVERVHVGHPSAPVGLSQALEALRDELESHMMKEELVLFPMMQRGDGATISYPIAQMRREHDDEVEHLRTIEHVTHGLSLPDGACGSWAALYTGLRKLTDDLVTHMHLENAVLFPRFEAGLQTI